MQVQDEMNNVGRQCTLVGSEVRWRVVAAVSGDRYAVIDSIGQGWARLVSLRDMHNLI